MGIVQRRPNALDHYLVTCRILCNTQMDELNYFSYCMNELYGALNELSVSLEYFRLLKNPCIDFELKISTVECF